MTRHTHSLGGWGGKIHLGTKGQEAVYERFMAILSYVSRFQDPQRLRADRRAPRCHQLGVAKTSFAVSPGTRRGSLRFPSFSPPPCPLTSPHPHPSSPWRKGVGEAQAATKRRGGRRSETAASAPRRPQPLALSSVCACALGRPPPGSAGGRGARREAGGGGSRRPRAAGGGGGSFVKGLGPTHTPCRGWLALPPRQRESWILEPTALPPTRSQPPPDRGSIHPASRRRQWRRLGASGRRRS